MQSEAIVLAVGDTHARPGGPRLTFVRVSQDSRCPTGVTCVWEGDATVEIAVRTGDGAGEVVTLHANPRFAREAVVGGLRLRLERLEPYPAADAPIASDAYRAHLTLSPRPAAPAA